MQIVVIDDNYLIRELIKTELHGLGTAVGVNFEFYSSDNGIEGLGYLYVTKPQLIIIDTTLPKYSGREVLEYLTTNEKFSKIPVIVLSEDNHTKLPNNYTIVSKKGSNFFGRLRQEVRVRMKFILTARNSFRTRLANAVIRLENKGDQVLHAVERQRGLALPGFIMWLVLQFLGSFVYTVYILFSRRINEADIAQEKRDLRHYRVRVYPTLATTIAAFAFLVLQVGLFTLGGMTIFSTRLNSVFAITQGEKIEFNLATAEFNENRIEYVNGGLKLKLPSQESSEPGPQEDLPEQMNPTESQPPNQPQNQPQNQPSSTPTVLGNSTAEPALDSAQASNLGLIPVKITEGIPFSSLKSLSAEGNTNEATIAPMLTYQLSPDGEDYYYWGTEGWEKTEASSSSNTLKDVNEHLAEYQSNVGGNILYIQVIFNSDGVSSLNLQKLELERTLDLVSPVNATPEEGPVEQTIVQLAPVSAPTADPLTPTDSAIASTELPAPTIFSASFANGNKVIAGKILAENDARLNIPAEDLAKYKVKTYYTSSRDIKDPASRKGEFIGESGLEVNPRGEYTFFVSVPNRAGGYVTAELTYELVSATGESTIITSELAAPVQNSTFTIDSTGDQADTNAGNGVCYSFAATCTLRAAMEESSALAGKDNIYFNIPITDSGYRDYDSPSAPSSGDSTGGDDYWTIAPQTDLPFSFSASNIDGSTQETLSAHNRNTAGPDIEVSGIAGSMNSAFRYIGSGGSNYYETLNPNNTSVLRGLVINRFIGYQVALSAGGGLLIEDNYICTDVKGLASIAAEGDGIDASGYSVSVLSNVIGNCSSNGVGIKADMDYGKVQGNIIGFDRTGESALIMGTAISAQSEVERDSLIGGTNPGEGNQLRGDNFCANINGSTTVGNSFRVKVQNNTCGIRASAASAVSSGGMAFTDIDEISGNVSAETIHINTGNTTVSNNIVGTNVGKTLNFGGLSGYGFIFNTLGAPLTFTNNSSYYNNIGIYSTSLVDLIGNDIQYNRYGIYINKSDGNAPLAVPENYSIANNTINNNSRDAITIFGFSPKIQGNEIKNNANWGIISTSIVNFVSQSRLTNDNDANARPQIGGSALLSGSLCGGTQRNCIEGNVYGGVLSKEGVPFNEATLYADNTFGNGNGTDTDSDNKGDRNIEIAWQGLFELFSGTTRRTDLINGAVSSLPLANTVYVRTADAPSTRVTNLNGKNTTISCLAAGDCPASGHTTGTAGLTEIFANGAFPNFTNGPHYLVSQYVINGVGATINYASHQVDTSHFSSPVFSFDGNSTTHPVTTGSARTINSLTYNDRGEPWTNLPTATRTIASNDFGKYQVMEVEYVDANPIWNGSEYIILVDGSSDEDNVSTCGVNDGSGVYTGGGCGGPSGLPDGKTSLREAIYVANQLPVNTTKKILFCLSNGTGGDATGLGGLTTACGTGGADANYNLSGYTNKWKITVNTDLPDITTKNVQLLANQAYNWTNSGSYPDPVAQPRIVLSFTAGDLAFLNDNIVIKGLQLEGSSSQCRIFGNGGNIGIQIGGNNNLDRNVIWQGSRNIYFTTINNAIIQGNFIGVGPDGYTRQANTSDYSIVLGNQVNANNLIGGPGLARNLISGGGIGIEVFGPNNTIENNYFGLGYNGVASTGPFTTVIRVGSGATSISYEDTLIKDNVMKNYTNVGIGVYYPAYTIQPNYEVNIFGNKVGVDINLLPQTVATARGIISWFANNISIGDPADASKANYVGGNRLGLDLWKGEITLGINYLGVSPNSNAGFHNQNAVYNYGETPNIDYSKLLISDQHNVAIIIDSRFSSNETIDLSSLGKLKAKVSAIDAYRTPPSDYGNINANDAGDTDLVGFVGNPMQNWPQITKVIYLGGGEYRVSGELEGNLTEAPFNIQLCRSYETTNGHGGCEQYLGEVTTSSTASFAWSVDVTVFGDSGDEGRYFSATATNSNGATSEFGPNFQASSSNPDYTQQDYPISLVSPIANVEIDDPRPTLVWQPSLDPDLINYEIYFDGQLQATLPADKTNYKIAGPQGLGVHTWQVRGLREGGVVNGTSSTESFQIINGAELALISPTAGVSLNSNLPVFDWNGEDTTGAIAYYELYLNAELYATIPENQPTEYITSEALPEGDYTWYIVAYNAQGQKLTQTSSATFKIFLVYVLQLDADIKTANNLLAQLKLTWDYTGNMPPFASTQKLVIKDENGQEIIVQSALAYDLRSFELTAEQLAMLKVGENYTVSLELIIAGQSRAQAEKVFNTNIIVNVLPTTDLPDGSVGAEGNGITAQSILDNLAKGIAIAVPAVVSAAPFLAGGVGVLALSSGDELLHVLGILIGIILPRKRKYWGMVFDAQHGHPVPIAFARITIRTPEGRILTQTLTDLQGKYALNVGQYGEVILEVQATNYQLRKLPIVLMAGKEIVEDIVLTKLGAGELTLLEKLKVQMQVNPQSWRRVLFAITLAGALYTAYSTIQNPSFLNYILLTIYALLFLIAASLELVYRSRQSRGRLVFLESNLAAAGEVVRFYQGAKLSDLALTNAQGEIKINLAPGTYQLLLNSPRYRLVGGEGLEKEVTVGDNGKLTRDIYITSKITAESHNDPIGESAKFQLG